MLAGGHSFKIEGGRIPAQKFYILYKDLKGKKGKPEALTNS